MGHWLTAWICGRVAGSNKLDSLKGDPRMVPRTAHSGTIEPVVFHQLAQEALGNTDASNITYTYCIVEASETFTNLITRCVPYESISGKLISSQKSTSHLPKNKTFNP